MRTSTAAFMAGITAGSILIGGLTLYLGASMSDTATAESAGTSESFVMSGITSDVTREPAPTAPADPSMAPAPVAPPIPVALDPMSAAYNPFLEPSDPAYVTEAEMTTWYALQDVIRQCMTEQGLEFLDFDWRLNESPQPPRQEFAEREAWLQAMYGANRLNPSSDWRESGCSGYGLHITGDTVH
ncbi:hypothetical protein D6T64_19710 [Cryobacterium melibiosiphilum]|uniref:Uncharacterized protein n=1 Tax=Cryobacterium melibiosiphilum TaxID=995039 RepID=A0A3A5M9X2_9MICO|nr:hypothetical protein [Cryobacterium melibiosiphilum]RJT85165.1 hypothetical protein D6T64_19710 [Cryobacterium melibiosiphilum]